MWRVRADSMELNVVPQNRIDERGIDDVGRGPVDLHLARGGSGRRHGSPEGSAGTRVDRTAMDCQRGFVSTRGVEDEGPRGAEDRKSVGIEDFEDALDEAQAGACAHIDVISELLARRRRAVVDEILDASGDDAVDGIARRGRRVGIDSEILARLGGRRSRPVERDGDANARRVIGDAHGVVRGEGELDRGRAPLGGEGEGRGEPRFDGPREGDGFWRRGGRRLGEASLLRGHAGSSGLG